jgi:hypothetical protein
MIAANRSMDAMELGMVFVRATGFLQLVGCLFIAP